MSLLPPGLSVPLVCVITFCWLAFVWGGSDQIRGCGRNKITKRSHNLQLINASSNIMCSCVCFCFTLLKLKHCIRAQIWPLSNNLLHFSFLSCVATFNKKHNGSKSKWAHQRKSVWIIISERKQGLMLFLIVKLFSSYPLCRMKTQSNRSSGKPSTWSLKETKMSAIS